jgi:RIO kinase 1
MASLSDFNDNLETFVPSYAAALDPLHHERQWLIDSVATFYQQNMITDVTRLVKGGKEANVYCCPANPAIGYELLAAKLYRPRMLRNLSPCRPRCEASACSRTVESRPPLKATT